MQAADIHQLEGVLLLLLVLVVGFGAMAKRIGTPYPIVLVIAGLVIGLIPGIPQFSLNPDIVFLAILPPLIFAAAFNTAWRDFRYNLFSIGMLAFGLVGFTVLGVAWGAGWILPGFDWRLGLVLGAVISTTDAIAATSIAKTLGLPKRIIDVLEGESLVNDASGLLALEFTVALVVSGHNPGLAAGIWRLIYLVAGGITVGLAIGWLIHWMEDYINDGPIETTISLLAPYAVYLGAEAIGASGVMAAVACGLYLGHHSEHYFSSTVRIEAEAFWNTLTFALNGIVFALIGLQLPHILDSIHGISLPRLLLRGLAFSALVIVLRLIWVYPGAHLSYLLRRKLQGQHEATPDKRGIFVVGWTGMRGVVALAAAISLPDTVDSGAAFPQRSVIEFMTFCVIFVTLVLQGLTLPALIRKLGLGAKNNDCEEKEARRLTLEAAVLRLEQMRGQAGASELELYNDLAKFYGHRLTRVNAEDEVATSRVEKFRGIARELRGVERETLRDLREQGRVNEEVSRLLQREMDLNEAQYQRE